MICKATAVTAFPFPPTPVSGSVWHNVGGWKDYSGLVLGWTIPLPVRTLSNIQEATDAAGVMSLYLRLITSVKPRLRGMRRCSLAWIDCLSDFVTYEKAIAHLRLCPNTTRCRHVSRRCFSETQSGPKYSAHPIQNKPSAFFHLTSFSHENLPGIPVVATM